MASTISFSFTPSSLFLAKGKKSMPAPNSPVLASSPISTSDASDYEEDEAYFSDVSSTSSRASSSSSHSNSPVLGDFTFSSDEEFQDYYAIVTGQVSEPASPSTSYSSTSSSSSSASSSSGKQSKKASSSSKPSKTRKGSSAFFLSGSSFSSSSSSLSPSLASQNPNLSRAHSKLSENLQRLASLSYKGEQREQSAEEDVETRFERALMFAEWTRSEDGQWQIPAGANKNLVKLVSQVL